ncbi:MAG: ArnT family glycosyltransferase [Nitrososphaerales archaeon]
MLTVTWLKQKIKFSKSEVLILAGVLAVASIFRFWDLTSIGIRGDEAVYAGQALIIAGDEEMTRFFVLASRGTSNFLFHQGLQAIVYALAGFSDFTTRLLPALLSVLTVGVVFLLGREMFNKWTGLLAAFLLAINGYAVSLGRLALLDSTMVFFFTLSMLFLAKWIKTGESKWAYVLAACTGIAIMAKVPAFIIIPIVIFTVLATGQFRNLNRNTIALSVLVFAGSLTPAVFQIVSNPDLYMSFLSEGTSRVSNVPATYYYDKLTTYAGTFFIGITILGTAVALLYRKKGDMLCLIWLAVVVVFFQMYSLKGWNYILPLIPVATILAGRGLISIITFLKPLISRNANIQLLYSRKVIAGMLGILILTTASYSQAYASLYNMAYDRPFVGLREAAYWLEENVPPGAGVMTISHGSAQYVLSLYAKIDSYPFGTFKLHTVLPGGGTVPGAPPPEPLIQDGTVTYLVHYISTGGDDPIHIPIKTPTEDNFISLIKKYDSETLYTFIDEYEALDGTVFQEPRLWIYEVGKRLPEPHLEVQANDGLIQLTGSGFLIDSYVNIYQGRTFIEKVPTDEVGSFTGEIKVSETSLPGEQLIVFDEAGNRVTTSLKVDQLAPAAQEME